MTVMAIEDQRVIALVPFYVESAYKKYTKCAMEVYLPTLEDLSQNESKTAVYGCHWLRDSSLRMGRQFSWGSGGLLSGGSREPGRTSIQGLLLIENKVLHLPRHL